MPQVDHSECSGGDTGGRDSKRLGHQHQGLQLHHEYSIAGSRQGLNEQRIESRKRVPLLMLGPLKFDHPQQPPPCSHTRRLSLPQTIGQANQVCKTFQVCHNSQGLAYTSVDIFAAMEPLFEQLQLSPINDYVNLVELDDCLPGGCCCSTPVEVQLTLPLQPGETAEKLMKLVGSYIEEKLPKAISNVVCIGQLRDAQCVAAGAPLIAEARRRLM